MLKKTLLGTALAMALAVPAIAPAAAQDVAPDMAGRSSVDQKNVHTPETLPAGRSMGGPAGDALAKPADPNRQPTGPSSNARPEDRGNNAANTQTGAAQAEGGTPPMAQRPAGAGQGRDEQARQRAQGQGGQGQGAQAQTGTPVERVPGRGETQAAGRTNAGAGITTPVELNKDQPRTVAGTVGGGRPAADQVRGSELQEFSVVGRDGKEIGSVADVVINYKTGKVDSLSVSAGGFAGVGDKVYGVDWEKVQSVDQNGERVQLSVNEDELSPNPDFAERPQSGNTNTR